MGLGSLGVALVVLEDTSSNKEIKTFDHVQVLVELYCHYNVIDYASGDA